MLAYHLHPFLWLLPIVMDLKYLLTINSFQLAPRNIDACMSMECSCRLDFNFWWSSKCDRDRSGSVVECLTRDRGARVRASTASLRCGPSARHIYPSLVLVQPRKTRLCLTERLLMGRKESNRSKCDFVSPSCQTCKSCRFCMYF